MSKTVNNLMKLVLPETTSAIDVVIPNIDEYPQVSVIVENDTDSLKITVNGVVVYDQLWDAMLKKVKTKPKAQSKPAKAQSNKRADLIARAKELGLTVHHRQKDETIEDMVSQEEARIEKASKKRLTQKEVKQIAAVADKKTKKTSKAK